jgi:hypothetical protein
MDRKKRVAYLMLAAIVLAAVAGGYAYREFHRTKPSGAELRVDRTVTAAQLVAEFSADEAKATAANAGRALDVEGLFKASDLADDAHPVVVVMADSTSTTSLRFSLDSSFRADLSALKYGSAIRMKGVCIGFQPDDMGLGADILFDRSIILTAENLKP